MKRTLDSLVAVYLDGCSNLTDGALVHVARIAGVPREVIGRAGAILDRLERESRNPSRPRVSGEERQLFEDRVREIRELGAEDSFSRTLITLRFLDQLLDVVDIAREAEVEEGVAARGYYRVSETFEIPWLRRLAFESAADDHWEQRSAQLLADDLSRAHRKLVMAVVDRQGDGVGVEKATRALLKENARDVERFRAVAEELRSAEGAGLAVASVVVRELSVISERVSTR